MCIEMNFLMWLNCDAHTVEVCCWINSFEDCLLLIYTFIAVPVHRLTVSLSAKEFFSLCFVKAIL